MLVKKNSFDFQVLALYYESLYVVPAGIIYKITAG